MTDEPLPPAADAVPAPPTSRLLAYRLLGLRLPDEYAQWVVEDTASSSFLTWRMVRTFLWGQVLVALAVVGLYVGKDTGEWISRMNLIRMELLVLAVMLFSSRQALVRRALRWHRVDKHGNPVERPKGFARVGNREAALVAVLVLIAWTAGATVFGVGLRPTGIQAVPCREADPAVMDRINAGKTNKKAVYITTRMIRYEGTDVVVALADLDGNTAVPSAKPTPTAKPSGSAGSGTGDDKILEIWIVTAEGVTRLGTKDSPSTTNFPANDKPDRGTFPAISRAAECLKQKPVR